MKLNVYQVAERYQVAVSTVYSWLTKNWMPKPRRLGGRVFWLEEDLARWDKSGNRRPCDEIENEVTK